MVSIFAFDNLRELSVHEFVFDYQRCLVKQRCSVVKLGGFSHSARSLFLALSARFYLFAHSVQHDCSPVQYASYVNDCHCHCHLTNFLMIDSFCCRQARQRRQGQRRRCQGRIFGCQALPQIN